MQWWNDIVDWVNSDEGWKILSTVVFPFVAIVLAGFIAAMIGRGATKRLITHHDREQRVSTVSALIGAARRATAWNTLSTSEQQHADHLAHEADVSLRLLPLAGSTMTADWAAHKIAEMKKDSVSFSFQAEQSLLDLRDRLVSWQEKPSRAKKLFKADLDLWTFEAAQEDKGLVEKQQEWAKQQVAAETGPITTAVPAPESVPAPASAAAPAAASAPETQAPSIPESKPITWNTPSPATSPTPAASAPTANPTPTTNSTPTTTATEPAATPATPARQTFAMPAASTGDAAPGDIVTPEGDIEVETPSPVSAQTVRQRILPDYTSDDLR